MKRKMTNVTSSEKESERKKGRAQPANEKPNQRKAREKEDTTTTSRGE